MATIFTKSGIAQRTASTSSNTSSGENFGDYNDAKLPAVSISSESSIPPLGETETTKKFWFQKSVKTDLNAIATQPSVYDDPETAKQYLPRSDWENLHRFNPLARWTWGEEKKLVRKIDLKIMFFACVMFMALELDRANISQANTDNFLPDLKLTTNDYNLGNTVFKLSFLLAELPSQLVSKWMGPDRWIPTQLSLWSIVAASQFWLSGRKSFLVCRALLGVLQGGFIPDIILYLSYFYKHHELAIRLSFFWTAMSIADILAGFLGFGIFHMRGVNGKSGWRWMFLIEGLFTLLVGLSAFVFMPAGPCQTKNWSRGKKGWFTEREEEIMVNRIIRNDPSKGSMHNRQPITPRLLWKSLKDVDQWQVPVYMIGLLFQIPMTPVQQYLTLSLRGLRFNTFQSNLLAIPWTVGHIFTMLGLSYASEMLGDLSITAMTGQIWALPFLIYLLKFNVKTTNRWKIWGVSTALLAYPNAHPIQVNWVSRNSNSVRSRTVSAACYNMFVQAGGIIASNIYRADDAPQYRRGNKVLISIAIANIGVYSATKLYYVWRNNQKDKKWKALSEGEKLKYLKTAGEQDDGNYKLDFRFAH